MSYNLADYQRVSKDPLQLGVVDVFRRESILMDKLSWEPSEQLTIQILRTKSLPTVAFRKIGASFAESKGQVEPISERVFDLGGYIDVDKLLVRSAAIVDQRALQTDMFTTSCAYAFQDYFINGDPTVDIDGFTGLWYRLKNYLPAAQTILGGSLDISPDATGLAANQARFVELINQTLHQLDGHKGDMILTNTTGYLRACAAVKGAGQYAEDEDSYGRMLSTWGPGGPAIVDIGCKGDQVTEIMGDLEAADGSALSGGLCTSFYFLKLGEKYLKGFQLYDIDVVDIGLLESGVAYRTVLDWPVGIFHVHPRTLSRLVGIVAN